jgi:hypothetical protein
MRSWSKVFPAGLTTMSMGMVSTAQGQRMKWMMPDGS